METIYISLDRIFPPKPKTKELSNNLFGQVFVPVVDGETNVQTGDGFCINRRRLLSLTYLREIRNGEHEPIYKVVQQAMIYYLSPISPNFELQVYLTETIEEEDIEIDDILMCFDDDLLLLSGKEDEVMNTTNDTTNSSESYPVPAIPISYQLAALEPPINPNVVMQYSKRWRAARPYMIRKKKNTSPAEKVARLSNVDWLTDWVIEVRQRKNNGRYDYFYHHKRVKLMCRSLVEVHNFHCFGVLPRKRSSLKTPNQRPPTTPAPRATPLFQAGPIIQEKFEQVNQNVNEAVAPPDQPMPEQVIKKRTENISGECVSEMLMKEAYDNLLMSNNSSSASATFGQTSATDHDDEQPPMSVEDFLRDSYNNLNNTPPDPNSSQSTQLDKKYVEDFLRDSYNNLLNTTPRPKSTRGYKRRKVAEKSAEEKTGGNEDVVINI